MITVHHLEDSRSQRILWLCEELGLDYKVVRHARDPQTQMAPAVLKKLHPLGTAPLVEVDDVVLAESGAIIEYLLATHDQQGRFKPADALGQAGRDYTFWLHFAEGSLMPMLVIGKVFMTIKATRMPFFAKPIAKKIASSVEQAYINPGLSKMLTLINQHLGKQDYFAGDALTGADIQMSFPLEAVGTIPDMIDNYPAIIAWLERIHARSAYRVALDKGGPYSFVSLD